MTDQVYVPGESAPSRIHIRTAIEVYIDYVCIDLDEKQHKSVTDVKSTKRFLCLHQLILICARWSTTISKLKLREHQNVDYVTKSIVFHPFAKNHRRPPSLRRSVSLPGSHLSLMAPFLPSHSSMELCTHQQALKAI